QKYNMKTVIIGSGNVATVLGEIIAAAGHPLLQVVARNEDRAATLAQALGCAYTTRYAGIDRTADLYIVALTDSALGPLGRPPPLPDNPVVHPAGALPAATLQPVTERCGVIWPL